MKWLEVMLSAVMETLVGLAVALIEGAVLDKTYLPSGSRREDVLTVVQVEDLQRRLEVAAKQQ